MTISISTQYARLIAKQNKISDAIAALQDECTHPNVVTGYNGNTGNYDPTCDRYWIEFKCPDCNKFWTVDQ